MSTYDFSLGNTTTKAGAKFYTQPPITWHSIDDAALAKMMQLSDAVAAKTKEQENQGGPLKVVLTRTVTSSDGGTIPPNANGTLTFDGLTYTGHLKAQRHAYQRGGELLDMGDKHAQKKEGQHGGRGRP